MTGKIRSTTSPQITTGKQRTINLAKTPSNQPSEEKEKNLSLEKVRGVIGRIDSARGSKIVEQQCINCLAAMLRNNPNNGLLIGACVNSTEARKLLPALILQTLTIKDWLENPTLIMAYAKLSNADRKTIDEIKQRLEQNPHDETAQELLQRIQGLPPKG